MNEMRKQLFILNTVFDRLTHCLPNSKTKDQFDQLKNWSALITLPSVHTAQCAVVHSGGSDL